MGAATHNSILLIVVLCVAASLLLVVLGFWLKRSGRISTRAAALGWALLCITPLFGAGAVMFTKHVAEEVTGETKPGVTRETDE